jgi:folate-binding protein YgfZ
MIDANQAELAVEGSAVAFRVDRDVVEADGPDATTYLQGQLSQDLGPVAIGSSCWSLLLQPQGKVDTWLRLTRLDGDRWLLDTDPGAGPAMVTRLERFKLRMKVTFTPRSWSMVAVRGPGAAAVPVPEGSVGADAAWPGVEGLDLLGPGPTVPDGIPDGDPLALEALRIRAGIPAMGLELDERTIPAEAGIVDRSVSFTKGCYVGQELVARIDSRGSNTPRRLWGLALEGTEVPSPGTEVSRDEAVVGAVTSAARSAVAGVVALAYLKRGVEAPLVVEVAGTPARVVALPTT